MTSANVQRVRGLYDAFARGDAGAVVGALAPDVVWNEAENFRYADGNPYVGPQAVAAGVFGRIAAEWEAFAATIDDILDAGDTVVARGRYSGVFKATGTPISAQLVHVWTVKDGRIAAFQQYTDTLQFARAMER